MPASVSVLIPTRNRPDILRQVIQHIQKQDVPVEIIILDDASAPETGAMMQSEFPDVKYAREETPHGPGFQRNKGAAMASGEYLFTIDDDCILESPRTISQTVASFSDSRIGAVTIPFVNVKQDNVLRYASPSSDGIHVTFDYFAGMIAFRRSAYEAIGGHRPYYFMQGEERDVATRLLKHGMCIRLGTADRIAHLESPVRDRPRIDKLGPRNLILFGWYNVPLRHFITHQAGATVLCMRHGLKAGHPIRVGIGLAQGYFGMLHEFLRREPVNNDVYLLGRWLKARGTATLEEIAPKLPPLDLNGRSN